MPYKIRFKHWLSRARMLEETHLPGAGLYSATEVTGKYPYLLYIFFQSNSSILPLRRNIRKFGKVTLSENSSEQAFSDCARLLEKKELVYFGGSDLLLRKLNNKQRLLNWKRQICRLCRDKACLRGSTQLFRCRDIADIIGALDKTEIRDIYALYRQGKEPVWVCFERLAQMNDLAAILRIAKPRWPRQFPCHSAKR